MGERLVLALCLVIAAGGCRSRLNGPGDVPALPPASVGAPVWPSFGGGPRDRRSGESSLSGAAVPSLRWTFRPGGDHEFAYVPPAIGHDGTIYAGTFEGSATPGTVASGLLFALDGQNGAVRWQVPVDLPIRSTPAIGLDGTVYVHLGGGVLAAFDGTTGARGFTTALDGATHEDGPESSPVLGADGTVYVASEGPHPALWAINPVSGSTLWSVPLRHESLSSPAVGADGSVFVGADDGGIVGVSAGGELRWTRRFDSAAATSPAIGDDGTVYVVVGEKDTPSGTPHFAAVALDPATGAVRWRTPLDGDIGTNNLVDESVSIGADGLLFTSVTSIKKFNGLELPDSSTLYALDPVTGAVRYRVTLPTMSEASDPLIDGAGHVIVATYGAEDGSTTEPPGVFAFNGADGTALWSLAVDAVPYGILNPALAADGALVFAARAGAVLVVGD